MDVTFSKSYSQPILVSNLKLVIDPLSVIIQNVWFTFIKDQQMFLIKFSSHNIVNHKY